MNTQDASPAARPMPALQLASYAMFALPLAMAALPVYLFAPPLYVRDGGLGLAGVGAVLLLVRLLAALADPLFGWWMASRQRQQGTLGYRFYVALSLAPMLAGYGALFHPPQLAGAALLAWFAGALRLVYLGYGLATIAHQSWGAAIAAGPPARVRIMAAREACGLLGAVFAAACSGVFGYRALALIFGASLLVTAWCLLRHAPAVRVPVPVPVPVPAPVPVPDGATRGGGALTAPWRNPAFRALFGVYAVSVLAGAIPATLFVFFVADRLRLPDGWAGPLLVLYLLSAAASMPLWSRLAQRRGEVAAWRAGMLMSALVFGWASVLGPGQGLEFAVICVLSGMAGGADLALPPAMLAGVTAVERDADPAPYFAWWNWCSQLALAVAAGAMLPLLALLGYQPGASGAGAAAGITALAAGYALLPCVLKLMAWALLARASNSIPAIPANPAIPAPLNRREP